MILTLHYKDEILRIEMDANDFLRLRNPSISETEIAAIAEKTSISPAILSEYVNDLRKDATEELEIDGACDYTDHFS